MPRYLTPSRVCLLVLVDIYLSGQVASSAKPKLLRFIAAHIELPTIVDYSSQTTALPHLTYVDASSFAKNLSDWSSNIPSRTVYDILLLHLWNLESLDHLYALFNRFGDRISSRASSSVGITAASPLGRLHRKCGVEFIRLQFVDADCLWKAIVAFREPTYDYWCRRGPGIVQRGLNEPDWSMTMLHSACHAADNTVTTVSQYIGTEDLDALVTFSIRQLQKFGSRISADLRSGLGQWVTSHAHSTLHSLHHFLVFFDSWRASQYTMALENIHRYFDYSLIASSGSDNLRLYYQYALLHLSALHADFGHWEESIGAMEECISTAKENQDTVCLNFALSWLLHLRQSNSRAMKPLFSNVRTIFGDEGESEEKDETAFLKAKARETRHWSLISGTLLEEARLEMYGGAGIARAVEQISQARYTAVKHNMPMSIPPALLFQGVYLHRLGQSTLGFAHYSSFESVYDYNCPLADLVRAKCQISLHSVMCGQYADAQASLQAMYHRVAEIPKLARRVQGCAILLQATKDIGRDHVEDAKEEVNQLRSFRSFDDHEISSEMDDVEFEYLISRRSLDQASALINERIDALRYRVTSDIAERLHLVVSNARIHCMTGRFAKAFSIALRVASGALNLRLIPVLIEGISVLARILIELSEFQAARDLIEAILPLAFEFEVLRHLGELHIALCEAYVGMAGDTDTVRSHNQQIYIRKAELCIARGTAILSSWLLLLNKSDHHVTDNDILVSLKQQNVSGQSDCLLMKSRLERWEGDRQAVARAEDLYMQLSADRGRSLRSS